MSEAVINISGVEATEEVLQELKKMLNDTAEAKHCEVVVADSFTGAQDIVVLLTAIGGGAIVVEVARTIRAWLNRHSFVKIRVNGISIEGVNADKALAIINNQRSDSDKNEGPEEQ